MYFLTLSPSHATEAVTKGTEEESFRAEMEPILELLQEAMDLSTGCSHFQLLVVEY